MRTITVIAFTALVLGSASLAAERPKITVGQTFTTTALDPGQRAAPPGR